jgi:L-lactate dehydrogenase
VRIVRAILRNERSVLTVSTLLAGEFGLRDVCLGVPCLLGADGVQRIIEGKLAPAEAAALAASARAVRETLDTLEQTHALAPAPGPGSA